MSDGERKQMLSQTGHRKLSSGKVEQSHIVITNILSRSGWGGGGNTQILMKSKIMVITHGLNPYGVSVPV